MEKIRAQGPEAFKAFFQSALTSAQETYQKNEGQDVPGWHWVECDACKKWRLVTGACLPRVCGSTHVGKEGVGGGSSHGAVMSHRVCGVEVHMCRPACLLRESTVKRVVGHVISTVNPALLHACRQQLA